MTEKQELVALRQAVADRTRTLWIVLLRSGGSMMIPREAMEDVSPHPTIESQVDLHGNMTLVCVQESGVGHD
jgi:hypothetical protein